MNTIMAPLRAPRHQCLTQLRTFTSTSTMLAKSTKQRLAFEHADVPPYPYGPSQIYKQSNFGLYGMAKIRYGNIVSKKNEIKTRRHWRPNVHFKRLYSDSLETKIRIRVTPRVLRTIDKCGGLDEYLLGEKPRRIKELGMGGWKLRWMIMNTDKVKERFRVQRERLGLPPLEFSETEEAERLRALETIDAELAQDGEFDIGGEELEAALQEGVEGEQEEGFMDEKPEGDAKTV